jgi:hypothetical protein
MFYENRVYRIHTFDDAAELAARITSDDFVSCTGFRFGDLLLVNDSTGPAGLQEYAIIDASGQVESLTVSWMTPERVLKTLISLSTSERRTYIPGATVDERHPQGPCWECA